MNSTKNNWDNETFPKADILHIRWAGWFMFFNVYYTRLANAGSLFILGFSIVWRLPYHPKAAYQMGWDAHWRLTQEHKGEVNGNQSKKE